VIVDPNDIRESLLLRSRLDDVVVTVAALIDCDRTDILASGQDAKRTDYGNKAANTLAQH
jgi:hypothetical protein